MLYFLAIVLAKVVFPDLGLPIISNWSGSFWAYVIMSYIKGLELS